MNTDHILEAAALRFQPLILQIRTVHVLLETEPSARARVHFIAIILVAACSHEAGLSQ